MIKVFVVDDHAIVRRGLIDILSGAENISIAGEAEDYSGALKFLRSNPVDVAIVDIALPGQNGLELLRHIKQIGMDIQVLILSIYSEEQYAVRAIKNGASGYLTKDSAPDELLKAIYKVASGGKYISSALAERLADTLTMNNHLVRHEQLSDRELQVLLAIGSGLPLVEIAERLGLSPKTVSTYRTRILEKMDFENNAAIVRYVLEHNLID
jgi:DNA-binding NarL/FixJ family response regulator